MIDIINWLPVVAIVTGIVAVTGIILHAWQKYRAKMGKLVTRFRRSAGVAGAIGIIFGKSKWGYICSPENDENAMIVTFGSTGSGKTATLIPSLGVWRGSIFVIDISGDIEKNAPDPNKVIFAPHNESTTPYSVFAAVDNAEDAAECQERLQAISFALIPTVQGEKAGDSAYFINSARDMLQACLIAYYAAGLDFIPICQTIVGLSFTSLLADLNASGNNVARRLIAGFDGMNEKTVAGVKQQLDSSLMLFATNPRMESCVRRGGISPETLESNSIYIKIDDERLEIYSDLLRLITSQTLSYLSGRPNNAEKHVLLCLDEFPSIGKLDILPALRKLRKKLVRISIFCQSLVDLEIIYGHAEAKAMLDNFGYKVLLSVTEPESQEYFSKLAGERIVERNTITTNNETGDTKSCALVDFLRAKLTFLFDTFIMNREYNCVCWRIILFLFYLRRA